MKKVTEVLATVVLLAVFTAPLVAQTPLSWLPVAITGPSCRGLHSMAYDSLRGRTVLFGGDDGSLLGDTWEWDGTTWTQVASAGPVGRIGHAMAYDSQRGRTVLFGGIGGVGSALFGDTWEWDGTNWTQVASTGPVPRYYHAMAYDSQRGHTVLFGGDSGSGNLGDTWVWDGTNWLPQIFATGPSARYGHAMAYDSLRGRTVLFGGNNGNTLSDTWEWDGASWTQAATTGLPGRNGHAMAYDSQRVIMFGGFYSDTATWWWDGNGWTGGGSNSPSARHDHAMAYDSRRGRPVLFGGFGTFGGCLGDTWEWNSNGSATTFGSGCGSPALDLSPVAGAQPILNATAQAALNNIPSSIAFVALGWSNTAFGPYALPLTLTGFGLPGCFLLQSSEFAALPVSFTSASTATFSLPLPNITGLIGLRCYLQGWAYAPGVNPGHTVVSNGIEWDIGF